MTTLYKGCVKSFRTIALPAPFARSASTAALAQTGDRAQFDIPKQPLSAALKAFAEQADMQLLYRSETINGATVRPLKGELDKRQALQRLLEGTNLEAVYSADDAATIRPRGKEPITKEGNTDGAAVEISSGVRDDDASSANVTRSKQPLASERSGLTQDLETVIVTGTRIRGGQSSSPVVTISQEEMRLSGHNSVGEAMRALPQNFNGGQNPGVAPGASNVGGIANQNVSDGSGINLRGLGPDATVTILNGSRLLYEGFAHATDVAVIPTAAIARIVVLLDGASTIYRTDKPTSEFQSLMRISYA